MHDRRSVRSLHQAYADKTESFFAGLGRAPGDPCAVRIRSFGPARTHIANGHDWLNRATLTGDETVAQVDEVVAHFDHAGARCHVEWNPGNCYRTDTWDDGLGRLLLDRGFRPRGFRCVWSIDTADAIGPDASPVAVRRFGAGELEAFLAVLAVTEGQSEAARAESRLNVLHGQGDDRWHHYVGHLDGVPCCNATLFTGDGIAYLEWGHTLERFRGRGCHRALVRHRLADARAAGCDVAFAVTDVGVASARSLQREGFRLAYNYVMLVRDAIPAR